MARLKRAGVVALIAVLLVGIGYVWGAWGRRAAEGRLARADAVVALSEARRNALAGSLDLYKLNFGAAAAHFEAARAISDRARLLLRAAGSPADPAEVASAVALLDGARALAARLDQAAGQKAAGAIAILDKVAGAVTE